MQRWPIKPEYRAAIINKLIQVVASPESSPREVTAAAKAILAAEAQNQVDEHKVVDVHTQQGGFDLAAIAAEIGVDFGVVSNAEAARIRSDNSDGVDGQRG
jgi:hypothetical protein